MQLKSFLSKTYKYICSISFFLSIIVFFVFLVICVFIILQIKLLFISKFCPFVFDINFFNNTTIDIFIIPHFKTTLYVFSIICYLIKNLWIPVLFLIFNFLVIKLFFKLNDKFKYLILSIFFAVSSLLFFTNNFVFIMISKILFVYIVFFVINSVLTDKNIIVKLLKIIPIVNIVCSPIHTFKSYIKNNNLIVCFCSIILLLWAFIILFSFTSQDYKNFFSKYSNITPKSIYNVQSDGLNSIFTMNYNEIQKLDNKNFNIIKDMQSKNYREHICINHEKSEIYAYINSVDNMVNKLVVFDNDLNIKKEKNLQYQGAERIDFDNKNNTICLCLDRSKKVFIFDMKSLDIIATKEIEEDFNDFVLFNFEDDSYILSFCANYDYFVVIPVDKNKTVKKYKCLKNQGYMALSKRNEELYIAFHQQGLIGVYDLKTYKLKRYIYTQYSVKCIYYNEEYNVLFAPGYLSGYMDIFLMNGNDQLLKTMFVGLFPRQPLYIKDKILIPSHLGLRKYELNLKELVEKNFR